MVDETGTPNNNTAPDSQNNADQADGQSSSQPTKYEFDRSLDTIGAGSEGFTSRFEGMDPANRSLAEALKLSFRVLQIIMLVLIVGYLMTGWNNVQEQEKGVRIVFGNILNIQPLGPGLHASWPYPIGEFLKVETSPQIMKVNDTFWLGLREEEKAKSFEDLNRTISQGLVPGEDGSIITADSNLAHTRWQVAYLIMDPLKFQKSVMNDNKGAQALVKTCMEHGVVMAAAVTNLSDIIQSRELMNSRVKKYAQEMLDKLDVGIEIQSVNCTEAKPPRSVLEDYEAVSKASAEAFQATEQALDQATKKLNEVAGGAHGKLTALINIYEAMLDGSEPAKSDIDKLSRSVQNPSEILARLTSPEAVLAEIDQVLLSPEAAGTVAKIINNARNSSLSQVTEAQNEWRKFEAYYAQYKANPRVVIFALWADNIKKIMARDIERFIVPDGTDYIDIRMNRDPDLVQQRAVKRTRELVKK